jgi:hypothetical protein
MSAGSMRRLAITDANRDDDTIDIAAFEYDAESYGVPNLTSEFFPVNDERIWPTGTARLPFMVFGYPTVHQLFDEEHIGARGIEIQATYDGGTASPHLHRVKMAQALDADGMSGGPVFYIGGAPSTFFVGFAGMVMRGGTQSSYLHFMAAHFLMQMVFNAPAAP